MVLKIGHLLLFSFQFILQLSIMQLYLNVSLSLWVVVHQKVWNVVQISSQETVIWFDSYVVKIVIIVLTVNVLQYSVVLVHVVLQYSVVWIHVVVHSAIVWIHVVFGVAIVVHASVVVWMMCVVVCVIFVADQNRHQFRFLFHLVVFFHSDQSIHNTPQNDYHGPTQTKQIPQNNIPMSVWKQKVFIWSKRSTLSEHYDHGHPETTKKKFHSNLLRREQSIWFHKPWLAHPNTQILQHSWRCDTCHQYYVEEMEDTNAIR